MTTPKVRKIVDLAHLRDDGVIAAYNELNGALASFGLLPHHAPTALIDDTGTADLAAVVVIANAAKALYNDHIADTDAHVAADDTNVVATADATVDQTEADDLLNDIKAQFNAHVALDSSHRAPAVVTQSISAADASDLGTSKTLAAAIVVALNRHFAGGASLVELVAP